MNLKEYKHTKFKLKPNRYTTPLTEFSLDELKTFNDIYFFCKENYRELEPTEKSAFPNSRIYQNMFRYITLMSSTRFELMVDCDLGCYRFTLGEGIDKEKNSVSGKKAVREIYKLAKKMNIDLKPYAVSVEEGLKIKETIQAPHIEEYCLKGVLPYAEYLEGDVHHLDLNSSYASRISEKIPALKPLFEEMYSKRKEKDEFYKHVLTNAIGCWQSPYCPSYENRKGGKLHPYEFAKLSKIAIDETRALIEKYVNILISSGRKVILTNTDGIWYKGEIYHDENEGEKLGQRKNDHINCKLIVKSKGAYQYEENGKVESVVRGRTNLDAYKKREDWTFGEILQDLTIKKYTFDKEKGVIAVYEEI